MTAPEHITQEPPPGNRRVQFSGDVVLFHLSLRPPQPGKAYVRTNIGHAHTMRREVVRKVECNEPRLERDWFDVPMHQTDSGAFEIRLGLYEVGHFEAKCHFIPEGEEEPIWPSGPNTVFNVQPADTCCSNILYNAFVRQFGPAKAASEQPRRPLAETLRDLDEAGYTVIPPSGTFRDLIGELDFIFGRLGCRWLQLLPIHPTPTTYGRMGRFGSPYAALSFTEVDPALAVFDPKATPLEQFLELADAVHARGGKILLDIAINHTGWAARLHESHPQWLARNAAGEIQNPGAWGVVWEDLTHLDYSHRDLWCYMAEVLLTWCRRGVNGFRCDAGYMIPVDAWQYMIAKVREQYPDTVFFLEGLGGKISVTRDLLNRANFNWAYSELFQNYDRDQIERYLPEAFDIAASDGITVHFAETHDNNRLAATSSTYARMRTALCALLSPNGAFAFANGVEWFATEKISVHDACSLNWDAPNNQVAEIATISALLKTHPAFGPDTHLELVGRGEGNFIALFRRHRPSGRWALVLGNLDWQHPVTASWDADILHWQAAGPTDLLSGAGMTVETAGRRQRLALLPGQVLCLVNAAGETDRLQWSTSVPEALHRQRLRSKTLEVLAACGAPVPADLSTAAAALAENPEAFCRGLNCDSDESRVIAWDHPADLKRQVMVPPGHFLLLRAKHPFKIRLRAGDRTMAAEESLTDTHGMAFALLRPQWNSEDHQHVNLKLSLYAPEQTRHVASELLLLGRSRQPSVQLTFSRKECYDKPLLALDTNGRGAMLRVHSDWNHLASRYDALLAANRDPVFPEDRRILLTRCRAWIVYQGYSHEINLDRLETFSFDYRNGVRWHYRVPTGQGEHIDLDIALRMLDEPANAVHLDVHRRKARPHAQNLDDRRPVKLIVRPDIEDRNFHDTTKAFTGPEQQWPSAVRATQEAFRFAPSDGTGFTVQVSRGHFVSEPEWYYMVHRPLEAERGLDPDSDLFSPGYFSSLVCGGETIRYAVHTLADPPGPGPWTRPAALPAETAAIPLERAMSLALEHYVVKRGAHRTVIAGFPWFLDWGRDTLIVARGLVAAGRLDTAKAIVLQFARFEEKGTLPNMIRGNDAANRDTSDAPLWLFTVCADLCRAMGSEDILDTDCDGRSIRAILVDMATALEGGLPNGVAMDPDSGLIFSPAHFTWMDTNFPAGSPRQGYPVEIQALWWAALAFLATIDAGNRARWDALARRVRDNLTALFWSPQLGYLVDCLHCSPGESAAQAVPDDALRPNQLLAITLGAVADHAICSAILSACQALLVPGAIRSLADRPVRAPLAVHHQGRLLNNPENPYWGTYTGDEDTRRKPAYHNGTAWTWPFPSFCEAWVATYGTAAVDTARAWLSSSIALINRHCIGHVPEIVDGDAPHHQRGCDAQAWGASELLRVWHLLSEPGNAESATN
jgi:starch synthase (maltosyl-transferring)